MDKRALLASVLLVGVALWISARRVAAAPSVWSEVVPPEAAQWFADTVAQVENAVQDVVSTVNGDNNLAAFLLMLRKAEGTDGPNGYYTLFGGSFFLEMDMHPMERFYGEWLKPGVQDYTTAAGAYQETFTTFKRLTAKLGTEGFGPEVQDAHAAELIAEAGALADVRTGRFDAAVSKLRNIWASLPGGGHNQRTRTVEFVRSAYVAAGGALA